MTPRRQSTSIFGWIRASTLVALLALAGPLAACSVPVFRFALERWYPDPYEVVVFHRGPLSVADRAIVETLEKASAGGKERPSNIEVTAVNLSAECSAEMISLWNEQLGASLPWMVVRLPRAVKKQETIWAGSFTPASAQAVLQSPARTAIAEALLKGDSAVWVLLESGDKAKDAAAAMLLETNLKKLQTTLKLPELKKDKPEDQISTDPGAPELRLSFRMRRISRDDTAERLFVQQLLNVEDDLKNFTEPMAIPIFGKGRALYALVGKGITDENIEQASSFLIGPCACEVKRQSPGMDLLFSMPWGERLRGEALAASQPPAISISRYPPEASLAINPIAALPTPTVEPEAHANPLFRNLLIVFGLVLAGVTGTALLLGRKQEEKV